MTVSPNRPSEITTLLIPATASTHLSPPGQTGPAQRLPVKKPSEPVSLRHAAPATINIRRLTPRAA
jgi:hypothetical protein